MGHVCEGFHVEHPGGAQLPSWGCSPAVLRGLGGQQIVRVLAPIAITKYHKPGGLSMTELSFSQL